MKKVKCVDRGDSEYLTDGKIYEVTAGEGDVDMFGDVINPGFFETSGDNGEPLFCCYLECAHATWELVE